MKQGDAYGLHRVLEPPGVLPQPAVKIDNTMECAHNELLIDVHTLNIDSASFTQLEKEADGDLKRIEQKIRSIVESRGKMQNPVTGSGGMLIGTVKDLGPAWESRDLKRGDKIATLVSLSLTPLRIDEILEIRPDIDQVDIRGQAILFESGLYARLPEDMEETLALAVLDVAGAPAQTARLVQEGDHVLLIGAGGKSGLLCLHEARKKAGKTGRVYALEYSDAGIEAIKKTELADYIIQTDAGNAPEVLKLFLECSGGRLADVVINNVNIPDTEMASILPCRDRGIIYFFSMATSFTKAALGAEGVGKDVTMMIGNGYAKNHAETALNVLRENSTLRRMFQKNYT